ncbi:hypothetical protein FUAX_22820 [Fulvitalea axinellae]|uniref:tRNA (Guanine-N1)-methyltransferase n=1 Tax=Fulvitalea axinellae TaxID=1182444 RepID=A0AAU9DFT6_9BACT|nr:hypothetical protein FUAX_22820 [Fulvitalea axinellae]
MIKLFRIGVLAFLMFQISHLELRAQATTQPAVASPTETATDLASRFYQMKKKSSNWKDYKVIKEGQLDAFWNEISDTLRVEKEQISELKASIVKKDAQIVSLNDTIKSKEVLVNESRHLTTHISVIGIDFSKGTYIYLTWGIILVLAGLMAAALMNTKVKNNAANVARKDLDELAKEYDDYKKKVFEREVKLKRELTTEMNKVEELKIKLKKK